MENNKIRVAITHGDTNAIGYELIFKTFSEPEMLELCIPIVYGSPKIATYHRNALNVQANFTIVNNASEAQDGKINIIPCFDDDVKVELGIPTPESGMAAIKALDRAMTDFRNGTYDILVNCPVNNSNIQIEGYKFGGIKKYIETCLGDGKQAITITMNERMRIASVTGNNTAFKDVTELITKETIEEKALTFFNTLKRDFNISNPRIAVLALNANADGKEEAETITPAIEELAEKKVQAFGPYAADEFFGNGYFENFDGILSMYYDQGVAPFKAICPDGCIEYNAALPIISTAPDTSVNFETAGKGETDDTCFRHAIFAAIDIFRNRNRYDEPMQNPLQKLYHEKHDEGDKVRFTIPKKREFTPRYNQSKKYKQTTENQPSAESQQNGDNQQTVENQQV